MSSLLARHLSLPILLSLGAGLGWGGVGRADPGPAPVREAARQSPAASPGSPPLADAQWCGIEASRPAPEPPPSCKLPGLPCGPVGVEQIRGGGGDPAEDLDGDGQPDLIIGGRREVPRPEVYAVIYRATEAGYVLADYRAVPPRAEPTFASVVLATPGSAPLLRDGYDLLEPGGRTLSIARLRRFDGQRFRTLLTFCAHRAEPGVAGEQREGLNRVEFIDVDKDGTKEAVVLGLIRPTVFRASESGLALTEDAALTQVFLQTHPEAVRARTLRADAARLTAAGEVRRAADTLQRAYALAPYDVELGIELSSALLRSEQPLRARELLLRLQYKAPERTSLSCAMAAAQRALRNPAGELPALKLCAERESDETLRAAALTRLRELQQPAAPPASPAAPPPASASDASPATTPPPPPPPAP